MNLKNKEFRSELINLALPISLQAILTSSLSLIDVLMVSYLGAEEVGAVGLINKLYFVVILTMTGLASGAAVLTSQCWGAKQYDKVNQYLTTALIYSVIFTGVISMGAFMFPDGLVGVMSNDVEIIAIGSSYLFYSASFAVMTGASLTIASVIRSTGESKLPMYASTVALVLNTVLNYGLIFGNLGMPELGVQGAAIATVISRFTELLLLAAILYRNRLVKLVTVNKKAFSTVWIQSYPLILNELFWSLGLFAYHVIYSYMGKDELAAISMLAPIEGIMIDIFVGFSVASSIMLGHRLGKSKFDEAYELSRFFLTRFPILGIGMGVLVALSNAQILSLYKEVDEHVIYMASGVLYVMAGTLWLKIHNMIACAGVLRSGGDTKFVLFVDIGTIWLVGVPVAIFAGLYLGLPLYLVALLLLSEEFVKLFLWQQRIAKRKWLRSLAAE